jgi:glycosyltransferase involved in cell wall biosynthesis
MTPKHSVIVITYNQEDLIGRALDSLIIQKDYIFEIIIADDCSTDNNWKAIKEYEARFPDLIKPYQNEKNLGIFGNIESTWSITTGNVIWYLSGDDEYCPGVFEKANELIVQNDLNPDEEFFTIYFDFKRVWPSGKSSTHSNYRVTKFNPISLKLRHLIFNRTTGVSKRVYKSYFPVKKDLGIATDSLQDIQVQIFSDKNVHFPMVGSIYHKNIGIGSKTHQIDALKSRILCIPELRKIIPDISKRDLKYLKHQENIATFQINGGLKRLFSCYKSYFNSLTFNFGLHFILKQTAYIGYLTYLFLINKKS